MHLRRRGGAKNKQRRALTKGIEKKTKKEKNRQRKEKMTKTKKNKIR